MLLLYRLRSSILLKYKTAMAVQLSLSAARPQITLSLCQVAIMLGSCVLSFQPRGVVISSAARRQQPCTRRILQHRCSAAAGSSSDSQGQPEACGQAKQGPALSHTQPSAQQQQQQQRQPQAAGQQDKAEQSADQEPLWWVEKFEARRQKLEQQQQQQHPQQPGNSISVAGAQPSSFAPATVSPASSPATAAAAPAADQPDKQSIPWLRVVLQLLQLTVAVAALVLWPASLYRTGLYNGKVWLLFVTYVLFFGGGSVWRLVRFGPLASRKKDKQAKSLGTRAAWALFVAMMPVLHWGAIGSYMKAKAAAAAAAAATAAAAAAAQQGAVERAHTQGPVSSLTLYDIIGLGLLAGAVWLNWQAARHLGRAYDRVVQPDALVTTGPYAWVQHPIYSSYMMLFCGYAMVLHSFGYALLALVVCLVYYKSRVALEADVLRDAFGDVYVQYQQSTKLFVPYVL